MPRMGFEPTIPVFERAKTVHVLDRAATVIDKEATSYIKYAPKTRLNNDNRLQILDANLSL
jgi:hypothetical protein